MLMAATTPLLSVAETTTDKLEFGKLVLYKRNQLVRDSLNITIIYLNDFLGWRMYSLADFCMIFAVTLGSIPISTHTYLWTVFLLAKRCVSRIEPGHHYWGHGQVAVFLEHDWSPVKLPQTVHLERTWLVGVLLHFFNCLLWHWSTIFWLFKIKCDKEELLVVASHGDHFGPGRVYLESNFLYRLKLGSVINGVDEDKVCIKGLYYHLYLFIFKPLHLHIFHSFRQGGIIDSIIDWRQCHAVNCARFFCP